MRRQPELRGKQERSFYSRPPDPVWSSTPHMAAVRARLAEFDPRVTVWWAANRGRWRLMEWAHVNGYWRPICYWEGARGEFREADAESMVAALGRMSANLKDVLQKVEEHNARIEAERGREFRAMQNEYLEDTRKMHESRIVTGGAIGPRKRAWLANESQGSHRKEVIKHLLRGWEERNGKKFDLL